MEPFKNMLGEEAARKIAKAMKRASASFPSEKFLKNIKKDLEPLELKDRMKLLKERLKNVLPANPKESFPLLVKALKENEKDDVGVSGFLVWPFTQYVSDEGHEHFDLSMKTLHKMTQVFTAEFAIRSFLISSEQKTLKQMLAWSQDPSEHVRRLASEGSRPLLPWGQKLTAFVSNPEKTWPLLENLKGDPSLYVRKSVANHINDHSKHHGDWVVKKLKTWDLEKHDWVIRHGTRTLVKKGHKGALTLHGIKSSKIKVLQQKVLTPKIKMGDFLQVEVKLQNPTSKPIKLILDHELGLLKANGKISPKVFKGKKLILPPKEILTLFSQIRVRSVTVRKYYYGKQAWTPILNGVKLNSLPFELRQ